MQGADHSVILKKNRLLRVCDVGNQSLRSVSGARTLGALSIGSTSGSLHQAEARAGQSLQDKSLCCAQASIPVQTAYAKAHLQFVSLCCPTTLLESVVIRSVIRYYVATGLHNMTLSWLSL